MSDPTVSMHLLRTNLRELLKPYLLAAGNQPGGQVQAAADLAFSLAEEIAVLAGGIADDELRYRLTLEIIQRMPPAIEGCRQENIATLAQQRSVQ